jgi:hypothetical protein
VNAEEQARDLVLAAVAEAHVLLGEHVCPDCESHWDVTEEDACETCGLSLDDLYLRLERKVAS